MTFQGTNIFTDDTTVDRTAGILSRLRSLEHNPLFGQQRYLVSQGSTTPALPFSWTRLGIAPVTVQIPEGGNARLRFAAIAGLNMASLQTGAVLWSIYNVYEPLDTIYAAGTMSAGDRGEHKVEDYYAGTNRKPMFAYGALIDYLPTVSGQQTYAIDVYCYSGTPSGVTVAGCALGVEIV